MNEDKKTLAEINAEVQAEAAKIQAERANQEEEVCEYCGGTGVYEVAFERPQTCVCQVEEAVNQEMIKGGEEQHDRDL